MIDSFVNWLWPGQVDNIQPEQSRTTRNFNDTNNIVQMQQFSHKQMRPFEESSPRVAIDPSGQHALTGGISNDRTVFIQAINIDSVSTLKNPNDNTIAYHEISWDDRNNMAFTQLCRLQFTPGGNDTYAATWNRGVRIFDSNTNQPITQYHTFNRSHWSDWHPTDKHLIAICANTRLDLVDIRQSPALRAGDFYAIWDTEQPSTDFRHYTLEDLKKLRIEIQAKEVDTIFRGDISCSWYPTDDNYLVNCNAYGCIKIFDRRTLRLLHAKNHGVNMFNMQMTPNGKYLFGWCRENHRLSQWKYDLDGVTLVRNFRLDVWELGTGDDRLHRLQYYVTDTHLFMPNKSTNWMPNESNMTAIQVFDVETCDKVKDIKAVKRGYNPTSDTNDYARVDAVVGLSNSHHGDQLYTLSDKCELGVWSFSEVSQEETEMQLLELERGMEERLAYEVPPIVTFNW